MPNADQELSVNAVLKGGFYHAGQVCVSVQRVYVPRAQARGWAQALADRAKRLKIGDPTDAATEVGPLIQHSETKRIHEWVMAAVDAGAKRLCGGDPLSPSTYPATVLLDPPLDADVSRKEIFGPVVCVYGYDDIERRSRRRTICRSRSRRRFSRAISTPPCAASSSSMRRR